jgi:Domain of unknown function (DUF4123)
MTHADPDRLRDILWPPDRNGALGDIFALLDCARDPRIYPLIKRQRINYSCLFAGDLPQELAEAAPYLVALSPHSHLTEALLTQGWGQSWGVLLESSAILHDLRRHFRRFLEVCDEQGKRLLFRYYDPRSSGSTCRPAIKRNSGSSSGRLIGLFSRAGDCLAQSSFGGARWPWSRFCCRARDL